MGMKPSEKGFDLDDSFFEEYEGGPKKSKKIKIQNEKTKSKDNSNQDEVAD